ncbi:MAG: hypothetical protein ACE5Q6_02620 [Dehalococcoidia bacterium]
MHDLVKLSRRELEEMFLSAQTPTMEEMNRTFDGSVLAGRLVLNTRLVRMFLNLGWFFWRGKTFETSGENEGRGINRFKIGPFRFLRYPCATRITAPLVGPTDAFRLDYDVPENPWFVRRLKDDVRKIDNGLFLGSFNIRFSGKVRLIAYFLLQSA